MSARAEVDTGRQRRGSRSGSRRERRVVGAVVVSALAVAVAAASLWPLYESPAFIRAAVAAIVLGEGIALLGARFRWGAWTIAACSALVVFVTGVPLAVPSLAIAGVLPSIDGLSALAGAVVLSWKQLLTITTPVGDYQTLLVPAFLLVLASTVTTASIALRARVPDAAAVVPVVLLAVGILLGPRETPFPFLVSGALCTVLLLWMAGLRERRAAAAAAAASSGSVALGRGERRRSTFTSVIAAVGVVLVAVTAGAGAASVVPARQERVVAREAIEKPFNPREYPSPLSSFRAYQRPDLADEVVMTARGLDGSRVRLAVMDDFDGVVWNVGTAEEPTASGSFERLPFRLEPDVDGTRTEASVTVGAYDGVWLPSAGYLGAVDFEGERSAALSDALYYNANAGTAAVTAGLRSGDVYAVEAVAPPLADADDVAELVPGGSPERPGDAPDGLLDFLDGASTAGATPGENLAAVLDQIASVGYVSHGVSPDEPPSPSGHGLDRLTRLLSDVPMVGDGEQYASLAALAARQLGFPSRVVMGFVSEDGNGDGNENGSEDGPVAFTGSDVAAWIEIQVVGRGWVAVDPTPEERPIPEEQPEDPTLIARPYPDLQPPVDEEPDRSEQNAPESSEPEDEPELDPFIALLLQIARILSWVVIIVAVLTSPFIAIVAAKARRRALRRRTPEPEERVAAGWREFRDAVIDHGIEPPASATRQEFAQLHGSRGAERLAVLADRVTFSPIETSAADADRAWAIVDDLRRSLASRVDRRGRLLALVSLRSLGLRRRGSAPARPAPRSSADHDRRAQRAPSGPTAGMGDR